MFNGGGGKNLRSDCDHNQPTLNWECPRILSFMNQPQEKSPLVVTCNDASVCVSRGVESCRPHTQDQVCYRTSTSGSVDWPPFIFSLERIQE
ncbi:Hypothetical protein SMAX5B_022340 [Scophthalmus maximus]|uniref:Uncharacterized protein n=1 Tax=Scophthalmus maximus TaxID=52904 RepID=A0A2U9C6K3_SCOMX|nr:Hypothetical protein SMAX5B_022340 [Scophthalmus maximus]